MTCNENDDISLQTNAVANNIQDTHENVAQPCDSNLLNYSELRRSVNAPINNREPPNEDEEDPLNEHRFPAVTCCHMPAVSYPRLSHS